MGFSYNIGDNFSGFSKPLNIVLPAPTIDFQRPAGATAYLHITFNNPLSELTIFEIESTVTGGSPVTEEISSLTFINNETAEIYLFAVPNTDVTYRARYMQNSVWSEWGTSNTETVLYIDVPLLEYSDWPVVAPGEGGSCWELLNGTGTYRLNGVISPTWYATLTNTTRYSLDLGYYYGSTWVSKYAGIAEVNSYVINFNSMHGEAISLEYRLYDSQEAIYLGVELPNVISGGISTRIPLVPPTSLDCVYNISGEWAEFDWDAPTSLAGYYLSTGSAEVDVYVIDGPAAQSQVSDNNVDIEGSPLTISTDFVDLVESGNQVRFRIRGVGPDIVSCWVTQVVSVA